MTAGEALAARLERIAESLRYWNNRKDAADVADAAALLAAPEPDDEPCPHGTASWALRSLCPCAECVYAVGATHDLIPRLRGYTDISGDLEYREDRNPAADLRARARALAEAVLRSAHGHDVPGRTWSPLTGCGCLSCQATALLALLDAEPTAASEGNFEHVCPHGVTTTWRRGITAGGNYCGKCHDSTSVPPSPGIPEAAAVLGVPATVPMTNTDRTSPLAPAPALDFAALAQALRDETEHAHLGKDNLWVSDWLYRNRVAVLAAFDAAARALRESEREPTDEEVAEALGGSDFWPFSRLDVVRAVRAARERCEARAKEGT